MFDNAEHSTPATGLGPVLLVGCGRMGQSLLSGWIEQGLREIQIVSSHAPHIGNFDRRVTVHSDASTIPDRFSPAVVVFAIKPQQALEAMPSYARFCASGAAFLSIMAGKTTAEIRAALSGGASVVRAMPNTPAAIRKGFTCAFAGHGVTPEQHHLCGALLSAIGEVVWIGDENLMDAVTAISGGGPAYVFLLTELLEAAAIEQGLPPDLARRMARSTVSGAGALLAGTEISAAQLRVDVTSPRGTTERALNVLMAPEAWPKLVREAISAATAYSRKLSSGR